MWNGLRTQEALEGGTFDRLKPLCVGTAEEPCPYQAHAPDRDNFKGKQFAIQAPKTSKVPKDFFEPTFKPLFEGEAYVDRMPYRELQPEKPDKGFLTSDFSKRDEFSMTLRAEQHRQQIKHETRMQKQAAEKLATKTGADSTQQMAAPPKKEVPLLFDLVFAGDSDLCIKAKRDTLNPTKLTKERNMGTYRTSAAMSQAALLAKPDAAAAAAAAPSPQQGGSSEQAAS